MDKSPDQPTESTEHDNFTLLLITVQEEIAWKFISVFLLSLAISSFVLSFSFIYFLYIFIIFCRLFLFFFSFLSLFLLTLFSDKFDFLY